MSRQNFKVIARYSRKHKELSRDRMSPVDVGLGVGPLAAPSKRVVPKLDEASKEDDRVLEIVKLICYEVAAGESRAFEKPVGARRPVNGESRNGSHARHCGLRLKRFPEELFRIDDEC